MMMSAKRCARPVSVTTPTMMPAVAQVAATLSTPVVPSFMACTKRWETGDTPGAARLSRATAAIGTNSRIEEYSVISGLVGSPTRPATTLARQTSSGNTTHTGTIAVSERSVLTMIASMVAQNTDSTGEKPSSMKAMIEISEPKWYQ